MNKFMIKTVHHRIDCSPKYFKNLTDARLELKIVAQSDDGWCILNEDSIYRESTNSWMKIYPIEYQSECTHCGPDDWNDEKQQCFNCGYGM